MQKILIVTKDKLPCLYLLPLAATLKDRGIEIAIAAQGLSAAKWKEAGYELFWEGKEKPEADDPVPAREILERFAPDAVLLGLGSPMRAEDMFGLVANVMKIPVIVFSDVWGATSRCRFIPEAVLTIDALDAEIAGERFKEAKITVVGDWVTKPIENPLHPWSRTKNSLFIAGQNPATIGEFVRVCLRAISRRDDWDVILSVHNKYKDHPENQAARMRLETSGVRVLSGNDYDGAHLAASADITASGFSSLLKVAMCNGRQTVSIATEPCIAQMAKSTGLDYYPLVRLGLCHPLSGEEFKLGQLLNERRLAADREARISYMKAIEPNLTRAIFAVLSAAKLS